MTRNIVFLTLPALRNQDLELMPHLLALADGGSRTRLRNSFPCVTWPSQATMLTGKTPEQHGVVANGFFWRDRQQIEMWTAGNDVILQPQIWDVIPKIDSSIKTAAWFPMLSKRCHADFICMPAPIHRPDGSEELWCYSKPQDFYGELLTKFGHFPLHHFWGPLANINSSKWICDSAIAAAEKFKPNFFYIYLPHLDYAAQKSGPDSEAAQTALAQLDGLIGTFASQMTRIYDNQLSWIAASEYAITTVDHVLFPNRVLRQAGLLNVKTIDGCEYLDLEQSAAWALVDHQFSHVFVARPTDETMRRVRKLFDGAAGVERVLIGKQRQELAIDHPRSGDAVIVSTANSWQAYYWWFDDSLAPNFARNVDIHRKPGYDPVELHVDMATRTIPLDATLVKGSHGAPPRTDPQLGVFLSSMPATTADEIGDTEIFDLVTSAFN
jgi:hypothetical protein